MIDSYRISNNHLDDLKIGLVYLAARSNHASKPWDLVQSYASCLIAEPLNVKQPANVQQNQCRYRANEKSKTPDAGELKQLPRALNQIKPTNLLRETYLAGISASEQGSHILIARSSYSIGSRVAILARLRLLIWRI
jgi:hypothetical protein